MPAAPQCRDGAARGNRALRDQLAAAAAQACDDAVDQWVVRGAVDLRDVEPVWGGGKPRDLPVADVAAKQDHPAAGRQRAVEMLDAARLDPAAGIEHPDMPQMRVLGGDPAEIVPHAAHDRVDPRLRYIREGG